MNTITPIAWLSDIHLNFLSEEEREQFYQACAKSSAESFVLTGDIDESRSLCYRLKEFVNAVKRPVYFVLGNHDYYDSAISKVKQEIRSLCSRTPDLHWLGEGNHVQLNSLTWLIGEDGWTDTRYGDFENSPVVLNDTKKIADLRIAQSGGKDTLRELLQSLADRDAENLRQSLEAVTDNDRWQHGKTIVIATHVPPFPESCLHDNRPCDQDWLPWFSSKAMGDVIMTFAERFPRHHFIVLCGHTHHAAHYQPRQNLIVRTAEAEYCHPVIQEVIRAGTEPKEVVHPVVQGYDGFVFYHQPVVQLPPSDPDKEHKTSANPCSLT